MSKKRPTRPAGSGDRRFLRDSGKIHQEIRKAKGVLVRSGNEDERRRALERIDAAQMNLRALSKARFEKIANERTVTALRAMDNLIRLTMQTRYAAILTHEHANNVIQHLRAKCDAVAAALNGTVESQAARQAVGVFVEMSIFTTPGGIQAAE